jgi:hypothetical protein
VLRTIGTAYSTGDRVTVGYETGSPPVVDLMHLCHCIIWHRLPFKTFLSTYFVPQAWWFMDVSRLWIES